MPPFSSPFPTTSSKPGHGTVVLSLLPPGTPAFTTLSTTYPLKLVPSTPHTIPHASPTRPVNPTSKSENAEEDIDNRLHPNNAAPSTPSQTSLLFLLTYGGGLLAGDAITLSLTLNRGTRLVVTTQGMSKIYPPPPPPFPPPPPSTQHITSHLHPHTTLWLAPASTQPFRGSTYHSRQRFHLADTASLGVVEWVNAGRGARGEDWDLRGWGSWVDVFEMGAEDGKEGPGRLVVRDNLILDNNKHNSGDGVGNAGLRERMDGMGVVGTVLLLGPVFGSLAAFFVGEFEGGGRIGGRDWGGVGDVGGGGGGRGDEEKRRRQRWRGERQRMEREQGVVWTACHVRGRRCCVVKFMAREMQGARDWLGGMLREEGTVGREFGEGGLMFVR